LDAALRSSSQALRLAALRALGEQSHRLGPPAVRLIGHSAAAGPSDERLAAYRALGRLRDPALATAIPTLIEGARSPSEAQRGQALAALGRLGAGDARVLSTLIEGALDRARDARAAAQRALARHLGRFADPRQLWRALRESEANALVRRTMVAALAQYGRKQPGGEAQLEQWTGKLPGETPVVVRSAARLALLLARSGEPSERVLGWLYGW
jgi:HEAT repeat protein